MSYQANGNYTENKTKIIEHFDANNILYTANGNVGIGTENPEKKLDVNGDIRAKNICLVNSDGTNERCIDFSVAFLTTEMLRAILPENIQDLSDLSSMNTTEIGDVIQKINDQSTADSFENPSN